jgi:cell wall-associated NlpC family hydrolase
MQKRVWFQRGVAGLALFVFFCLGGCSFKSITGADPHASRQGAAASLGNKVARTALTQLGVPYRLGGASPQKGFDCSGLIYWAFQQNGVQVPRVTTQQAGAGRPVPRAQLLPGDIVVFRVPASPRGLHTGIYTGQGNFIHSPNSRGKVRVESLDAAYWRKSFLTARRIPVTQARR